ncbi:type VI secretion system-associated FHA domain protein TagH [Sphingomonas sp. PB4P5]|uniref:type VI secretion system-associated FHA domain protein TagH n=1 Tax=Parasphingomonas puruogangriensis TaxID=3096155 RepID=UPI002FC5EBD3
MTLTLSIRNVAGLDNGMPLEFVMHRRGAVIGRAPTCDWSLPDPRSHISSRHCEVTFDGQHYVLTDLSTNGTFLNGAGARLPAPHRIDDGDVLQIGQYEIGARLSGQAGLRDDETPPAVQPWRGWDEGAAVAERPAAPASGWASATPPAASTSAGWQPQLGPSLARTDQPRAFAPAPTSGGWAAPIAAPEAPVSSAWAAATPTPEPASGWSSAAPDRPAAPSPDDVWGRIAEGNVVDWARGGFGQPVEPPRDPLGLAPAAPRAALPVETPQMARFGASDDGWGTPAPPPAAPAPMAAPPAAQTTTPAAPGGPEQFIAATGLSTALVADRSADVLGRGGRLLHRLVAGLVVMVEARARAKAQLGAETTAFNPEGNNPIKFARTPDEALAMLLNPPQRGFMDAERAIEDAFVDLQSHQMATLRAMQGALKATLDRFSPTAIRGRAESGGLLERILPAARDAALWQAYEKEFGGVAQGSDEAFMDVFAKEFRRAYNDQARRDG